ncbi:ancient ubiquitous protein 1 [Elysia marginata]|uniref:Ancient ubiquitous protein 1 n=1 Tax=Elysia marginata TaxID=1093978 RepID=A0AAV4H1Y5_9GAST|nr:ancient ubiquitous protein 1 [Elysia marginata]
MPSTVSESAVRNIITFERFSSYGSITTLVLYLPIGLALGLVRCFIFLHACLLFFLLPNSSLKRGILRGMLTVIGLPIATQGKPRVNDKSKKIFVSNHITNFDPFILSLLHPHVLAIEFPSQSLPKNVPSKKVEISADKEHQDTVRELKEKLKDCTDPVLFFPERAKTNGTGCLKFSHLPFEMDRPIQPSTYSSSTLEDLLWCLILPFTLFKIKYLPVTEKKKDESYGEFASRVQANMAKSFNLQAYTYSHADISQYVKERNRAEANIREVAHSEKEIESLSGMDHKGELSGMAKFQRMVLQVKDVLPDTPVALIEHDLISLRVMLRHMIPGGMENLEFAFTLEKPGKWPSGLEKPGK